MSERHERNRKELATLIAKALPHDGQAEVLRGVFVFRSSLMTQPVYGVTDPAFCVIAQGAKEVIIGEKRYRYDPAHYLLASVELPVTGQVYEASPSEPYLALRLNLDPVLVHSMIVEASLEVPKKAVDAMSLSVSRLDEELLDATVRLLRVTASPVEARIVAPLIIREIIFRLLSGEQGHRLRQGAIRGSHANRIAQAIDRLNKSFDQPLSVEGMARDLGMSASGFHHHFKAVTDMSPLQFQKQLRLHEARRLMLGEDLDAASAGLRVGYDDASHFNREYKRLFGAPPMRDVERLRGAAVRG